MQLAEDVDPAEELRQERFRQQYAANNTFFGIAIEIIEKAEKEGKASATLKKKNWFLELIKIDLGHRPITEISATEILVPLRRIESSGNYETARRVRAFISQVFRYAIATARAENDPTFGLRRALISPQVTHRAAILDPSEFGDLLRSVWNYGGAPATTAALKLMALLYPRPGELRHARWTEFDLDRKFWTIPAERAKMRREHRKPLSTESISILTELSQLTGEGELVFPAQGLAKRPISENTMNQAIRRMGFDKNTATAHGFRASASTMLNESGLWSSDAIEAELAHTDTNSVRRAYHRAVYWDERQKMTEWWACAVKDLLQ